VLSFLPSLFFPSLGVIGLGITAVLLDMGLQVTMITGQREIYAIDANSRSRINSVFTTCIFIGGAIGAALASLLYDNGGWRWVAIAGAVVVALALVKFVIDQRGPTGRRAVG
jgi:predicted MFS family arabinose efflux permease